MSKHGATQKFWFGLALRRLLESRNVKPNDRKNRESIRLAPPKHEFPAREELLHLFNLALGSDASLDRLSRRDALTIVIIGSLRTTAAPKNPSCLTEVKSVRRLGL